MELGPSTREDRRVVYEARERAIRLARKHLRVARDLLWNTRAGARSERLVLAADVPLSPSYEQLLGDLLDVALAVVEDGLPDRYFETIPAHDSRFGHVDAYCYADEAIENAAKIVAALKHRRSSGLQAERIAKLENVEGRSPEEAALYLAKAAQLRGAGT